MMTAAITEPMPTHNSLSLRQRAGFAISLALAAGAFLVVGESVLAPTNPLGAITLPGGVFGAKLLAAAMGLAVIVAGAATVLAGRRLVDVGTFAACVGLALASLQGGTTAVVLIAAADGQADGAPVGVATRFALESLAWLIVPLVVMFVSGIVHRRLFARTVEGDSAIPLQTAASELRSSGTTGSAARTPWRVGALHTLVASCVALLGIHLFSTGLGNRSIQHGQACFVVIAATFAGTWAAGRLVPVRSALWAILAVPVLAIVGYLWSSGGASLMPDLPESPFLRILPVQLISVGIATAIWTTWWLRGGDGPEKVAAGVGEVLAKLLASIGLGWLLGWLLGLGSG